MHNIYFSGKMGSGKTTCGSYLKEKFGYKQAKFAYPVYGIAEDYFGMIKKDVHLLQTIGTKVARDQINENIWINRFKEDLEIVEKTCVELNLINFYLVADDVRFLNEYEVLRDKGWFGIYLEASEETRCERLIKRDGSFKVENLKYKSETDLEKFKDKLCLINTEKSKEEMFKDIDILIRGMENL